MLYPKPALVILIAVIVPAELTTAVAAAETVATPDLNTSLVNDIVGFVVYQSIYLFIYLSMLMVPRFPPKEDG